MSKTPVQLKQVDSALAKQLGSFVDLPKVDVPFTTIVNRAQCTDFSKDLSTKMGIDRRTFGFLVPVLGETGSNGRIVSKPFNDVDDAVRCVGPWQSQTSTDGPEIQGLSTTESYMEITFYGTGLNILGIADSSRDTSVDVDGVFVATRSTGGNSTVLRQRFYRENQVFNMVSGLALGMHTVRLYALQSNRWYGYEVLNESSDISVLPGTAYLGGKRLYNSSLISQSYNSDFESGILGTRGGRVVVYLQDGEVKKALTPTNTTQQNLTSADHTNEEVVRTYHWREFGAGRSDDFASANKDTAANRGYTLDDGTTVLAGQGLREATSNQGFINDVDSQSWTFTFVGTGLDIVALTSGTGATVFINNTSVGTVSGYTNFSPIKIVSGLPYGTHTVRVQRGTSGNNIETINFVVYGPKKPTVPSDAIELADYCIMANYADNTATGTAVADNWGMPSGVLAKTIMREFVYSGANWSVGLDPVNVPFGHSAATNNNNNQPTELTFFGTGLVLHLAASGAGTYDFTIHVDTVLNASGVSVSNVTNLGGGSYRSSSTTSGAPARVKITGLSLGKHTVRLQRTAGTGNFGFSAFHIITPIHSVKYEGGGSFQGTLSIGSQGISDNREFTEDNTLNLPSWGQATSSTGGTLTTTSSTYIPLEDMMTTIRTKGRPIRIAGQISLNIIGLASGTGTINLQVMIDGLVGPNVVPLTSFYQLSTTMLNQDISIPFNMIVPVSEGVHSVQVFWRVSGTSATARSVSGGRILTVEEI